MKRRSFIANTAKAGLAGMWLSSPFDLMAEPSDSHIVILHTNDQHSRLDPFPMDGSKMQGLGGFARRADLIKKYRKQYPNVLLLDSGDIWQGTPYFNKFEGKPEFELMTEMGYQASTLGNHDFDNGVSGLIKMMPHAGFSFLNCNYQLAGSGLEEHVLTHRVFEYNKVRIGITGVGIDLYGLVLPSLCEKVVYDDPIKKADEMAHILKTKMDCDYVICLSHLGFDYKTDKVSDRILAKRSNHIDMILGGHTHTFMEKPEIVMNESGREVIINQVGWAGIMLGRIDLFFDYQKRLKTRLSIPEKIT